jgi:hypothetical protein
VKEVHGAVAIGAGDRRSCALTGDGQVMCWGMVGYDTSRARHTAYRRPPDMPPDWSDPAGDNSTITWTATPSLVPGVVGARELSSGADVDCILDAGGAECWSTDVHGPGPHALPPTRLPVASVVRVVAGERVACVLDAAGAVTCFPIEAGRLGSGVVVHF